VKPTATGRSPDVAPPAFAGIATFLRAPERPLPAVPDRAVAIAGVPLDGAGDPAGAAGGPRGIREASVSLLAALLPSMHGELVDVDSGRRLRFSADSPLVDTGDLDPLAGSGPLRDRLRAAAAGLARRAGLSVFLGGTRAITGPLLAGVAEGTGRRLGLLRLSSTLDLAEADPDRPLAPEAALRAALEVPVPVACLGVHGWQPAADWTVAGRAGVGRVVPLADWRKAGLAATTRSVAEDLCRAVDRLYVSIDIRVTDGAVVAGRGRVVSGGLLPGELLEACESLAALPLAAVDVVEVAPPLDATRRAEHLAVRALLALLLPRLAGPEAPR
jgi:agmatinase